MLLMSHFDKTVMNIYYLITKCAFCTIIYKDQGPGVRTELARSVHKDRGLNILQYEKHTQLINSLLYELRIRED